MREFIRTLGFLNLAAGIALLFFPGVVRPLMEARAEYARLSDTALRALGGWSLLAGGALVAVTSQQAGEVRVGEVIAPGRRVAA